ncbi:MAG: hypothetical protein K5768_07000, partial [Firmicutes bacterium]|nr:hypothetical protein [Bacillota bacterium]
MLKSNKKINKITAFITLIAICLTFSQISALAQSEEPAGGDKLLVSSYIINDTFDELSGTVTASNSISGWTYSSGTDGKAWITGGNALMFNTGGSNTSVVTRELGNVAGSPIITFDLSISVGDARQYWKFFDSNDNQICQIDIGRADNGNESLSLNSNPVIPVGVHGAGKKFYTLSFDFDNKNVTLDVAEYNYQCGFLNNSAENLSYLSVQTNPCWNNSNYILDNFKVISTKVRAYEEDKVWNLDNTEYTITENGEKYNYIHDTDYAGTKVAISGIIQIDYDLNITNGRARQSIRFYDIKDREVAQVYIGKVDGSSEADKAFSLNNAILMPSSAGSKHHTVTLDFKNKKADLIVGGVSLSAPVDFIDANAENLAYIRTETISMWNAEPPITYAYSNFSVVSKITAPEHVGSSDLTESEKNYYAYVVKDNFENGVLEDKMKSGGSLCEWQHKEVGSGCYIQIGGDTNNKYLEFYNTTITSAKNVTAIRNMPSNLTGKVKISTKFYISAATAYTSLRVRDSAGNNLAALFFGKNGKVSLNSNGDTALSFAAGKWSTINIEIDTELKTVKCSIDGTPFSDSPVVYADAGAASVSDVYLDTSAGSNTYVKIDDFKVYYDYTNEIKEAFDSIAESNISSQGLGEITNNLNDLGSIELEGFDISFSSRNEKALKSDGKIIRHNFTQTAELECMITKKTDFTCVQNAYVNKVFYIKILPNEGITDEEKLEDILEYYITYDFLTNEEPDQITHDLIELPQKAPDGVVLEWTSTETTVISTDGKVTRPEWREDDKEVILTVYATLGESQRTNDYEFIVLNELNPDEVFEIVLPMVDILDLANEQPTGIKTNLKLP